MLERLAQHQRLRVEPTALVEQAAETPALVGVLLERGLVVDRGQEPLVGDVEKRHAWRLVDAAALRLDHAVLDLVRHAEAVAAADRVRLTDDRDRVAALEVSDLYRQPALEPDPHRLGLDLYGRVPV